MDTSDSSDDESAYSGGPVRMMIGPRRRAPPERRPFTAVIRRDYFARPSSTQGRCSSPRMQRT